MEFLQKIGATLLSIVIALIPLWIFLGIKAIASPEGFWQNTVLLGIGMYFLGSIQFLLLIALLVFLYSVWND